MRCQRPVERTQRPRLPTTARPARSVARMQSRLRIGARTRALATYCSPARFVTTEREAGAASARPANAVQPSRAVTKRSDANLPYGR